MKKSFVHITIASLLSWLAILVFNVILRAIAGSIENEIVNSLFGAVMYTVAFCLCLLYVEQIRNGRGEDMFFADYEKEKYTSMKNDVNKIIAHEKDYLKVYLVIIAMCFVVNSVYIYLLNNVRVFFLTMIYAASLGWTALFPSSMGVLMSFVGYLLSAIVVPFFYLMTLLFYRRSINIRVKKDIV